MDMIATIMNLIRRKNWITPTQLTTSVAGPGLTGGNGTSISVLTDNASVDLNGSNQIEVKNQGITPAKLGAVAGSGLSGGNGTVLSITDGSISTRTSFNHSYSGGVPTGPWANFSSSGFSIPAATQPVTVNVSWAGSVNTPHVGGLNGHGLAVCIDNVLLIAYQWTTTSASYSFPAVIPASGLPQTPVVIAPNITLSPGGHTLQTFVHGSAGTGGGSGSYAITITLEYVYK